MKNLKRFLDKVVLVTGGTSGIGKAIAKSFLEEGAKVIICGTNVEKGESVKKELDNNNSNLLFIKTDISNSIEVRNLISCISDQFGTLDIAVNNAGIPGKIINIAEYPEEDWERLIQVNITGVFLCMKYELQYMLKKGNGVIINMSSALGLRGKANLAPYSASKHAILGLTKSAAFEFGDKGIRINALCPGGVNTEMDNIFYQGKTDAEKIKNERLKSYALGRMGYPNEIAKTTLWLNKKDSSFIYGASISIDGGKTAI
ncbi:MAG: glucose 1-dehydrogenase [Leptospiraceae bacterium]|nr:glucose 1-dehydrogenase [Leptospiraceae bacterium]